MLKVLQNESGSGTAKITNNKVRFSAVCLSGPMRLTGKLEFLLFHIYPNQYILSGGTPLDGLLAKTVDLSRLLGAVFYGSRFKM